MYEIKVYFILARFLFFCNFVLGVIFTLYTMDFIQGLMKIVCVQCNSCNKKHDFALKDCPWSILDVHLSDWITYWQFQITYNWFNWNKYCTLFVSLSHKTQYLFVLLTQKNTSSVSRLFTTNFVPDILRYFSRSQCDNYRVRNVFYWKMLRFTVYFVTKPYKMDERIFYLELQPWTKLYRQTVSRASVQQPRRFM